MRQKGKKVTGILLMAAMVMTLLTGCMGEKLEMKIAPDGTCSFNMVLMYEQSMFEQLSQSGSTSSGYVTTSGDYTQGKKTVGEKTYYTFSREYKFNNTQELTNFLTNKDTMYNTMISGSKNPSAYDKNSIEAMFESATVSQETFAAKMAQGSSVLSTAGASTENNLDKTNLNGATSMNEYYKKLGIIIEISVTLPSQVKESNGAVNGNTVTWNLDNMPADGTLLATSTDAKIISGDVTAPVVTGVKNGGLYSKKRSISISDDVCLQTMELNGTGYGVTHFSLSKNGTYTLTATDSNKNVTTLKFKIDTKKPVVKGAKTGKTYKKKVTLKFSDANGIKSVKMNGKKANTKKITCRKKGSYKVVVTDKAGNKTTVTFKIK